MLPILLGETVTDASMMAQTNNTSAASAASMASDCATSERSRRGKHLQTGHLSDEEGSYQALSVAFEDYSNHINYSVINILLDFVCAHNSTRFAV